MSSMRYTTARTDDDVDQIYALQAANLVSRVSAATQASEGFVTVRHEPEVLRRMNAAAPAVIARADAQVVGYALVMPRSFAVDVPILAPLFAVLDTLTWRGRSLRDDPRWFVMGQICVAAEYRGLGVVQGLYAAMAAAYGDRFDYTVTEIAARNVRSLRAHARVGFETIHVYADALTGEQWHVVGWDLTTAK